MDPGAKAVHKSQSMGDATDDAAYFTANANTTNRIQALESNGFQVGNNNESNANGTTYYYAAWSQETAPSISAIANQATGKNTATPAIAFTIGDAATAASSLTVCGSSSNTTLVPNGNITFGGSGANRTVTVAPATGQTGSATITVTVSDGLLQTSTTFTIWVTNLTQATQSGTATIGAGRLAATFEAS
ncbi:MAG: hypothetical protein AB7I50_19120 [Vicinamibacterales bacterium]